jgi:hypothetical protein
MSYEFHHMSGVSNEILNLFGSAFDENDFE